LLKKSIHGIFFNTQSKKRPLLRLPALATHREVQVSREAGCRERPTFVHPAQHGFCFASFFKHFACLKNPLGADFRVSPVGAWGLGAGMRQAKMAVHPYTAMGRKPKCRALQGSSNAAGGGDAGSGRSAGMRESGHRRVLKNSFFITLLAAFSA